MNFLKHIFVSLRLSVEHSQTLADIYYRSPRHYQLFHLSPVSLKQGGVAVLVLDFDGVLAAYGESSPVEELRPWLQECIATFGAAQVFILSNQPLPSRVAYFNKYYPGVRFIADVKKKPFPDGLEKIMALTGQLSRALRLVDDRLLTGGLAACVANVQFTYITHPYVLFSKYPFQELFFMVLRFMERRLVQGIDLVKKAMN
jgi:hypothetical protein